MTVVQRDGSTVGTYTYNALGQRTAKVATFPAAISQRFVYDEGSQLLGEYGSGARDYIWLDDLPVAVVDTAGTTSTVSYVHADGLNSPRAVADGSGNTIWQLAYQTNPFGEQQPVSASGYAFNFRFPGQYFDAESGLAYNINRDYEAATGRYVQSDPIGLEGGVSTYDYSMANPLKFTDPSGKITNPLEFTCIDPVQPVCWAGVAVDLGTTLLGGAAIVDAMRPHNTDPQAIAEYDAYKQAYQQPEPPDLDKCALLRWKLAREQALLAGRIAWDIKWGPGTHANAIQETRNAIRNYERKLERAGCKCP